MDKIGRFCSTGKDFARFFCLAGLLTFTVTPARPGAAQQLSSVDSRLIQRIQNAILDDSRLPMAGISITVHNGAVKLKGAVETLAQKRWMQEVAYAVAGVKLVVNQLYVDTARFSDTELAGIVRQRLAKFPPDHLDFSRVKVSADAGKITLRGEVRSWGARHQADEVVALIGGVRLINNKLKVRDPENNSDERVTAAVKQALRHRIQMSNEYAVKVSVRRGVVTLQGKLRTAREKSIAVQTVLFVGGVVDLINKIQVVPH